MKKIILISIVLFLSTLSGVSAATLQPSLSTQMAKQDQINKKNAITSRLQEQARIRQEAKERVLAQKYKRATAQHIANSASTATPTSSTTPVIAPSLTPSLTLQRPPEVSKTPSITILPSSNTPSPPNVDMARVRSTWLEWYNTVRVSEGLSQYSYDDRLNSTAYDWNITFASGKGQNHHTRNTGDGYYNFGVIDNWFITRGINPIVINRSKHTENVGYGSYSCNSSDCTESLIRSIRSTFNFFMSEKGKSYDLHYRSIVQPYFTKIGLSVIVVPSEQRYYLVVHYITQ